MIIFNKPQIMFGPLQKNISLPLRKRYVTNTIVFSLLVFQADSQVLTLKDAVSTAIENYGTIKAKSDYVKASQVLVKESSDQHLPEFSLGLQNVYGTANGVFGPAYPGKVLGASSSGPFFLEQNWNSAFGALYLANVNWDVFTFGKVRESVKVAKAQVMRETQNLEQEKFQHEIRVAGAYLNLLAAQRLRISQQKNLDRANEIRSVVVARTKNGLIAGVDSSLANAEVSNAKIALTNALDVEKEQASRLAQLMGVPNREFNLDTLFLNRLPASLFDSTAQASEHPVLKYFQSRIDVSRQQEISFDRLKFPVVSLFGVIQSRGTGFGESYSALNPKDYNHDYWSGIKPARSNYVVGVGIFWNLVNPIKVAHQVAAQQFTSQGLKNEYEVVSQQLQSQQILADEKIKHALSNYQEAPVQIKAASDAYLQKTVMYTNGLANIVDITQALYTLNRAETDREIANNNVWQALLYKAAASGDFTLFVNEFQ
ncbi:TolC family protein [Flavihumibacter fluvii]|uniref:TolC family protein n=1 Tax=Flavihumibacter fluvii TaxID=2838157 RepID=UPI001BDF2DD6|nr:TolC family protein [Flavihumibacter fluvii]ULQ53201.1 TolC family protein [Flavihumibacter fluvii]